VKISVVIPTHNRPQQLQQCLTSFLKVEYPRDEFEIVIGDDCSPQDLTPVIVPFQSQLNVQLVRNVVNSGPATARNTAAKLATGALIALTDDDCLPDPGWLTAFETATLQHPTALLGGQLRNAYPNNMYAEASQIISDMAYAHFNRNPNDAKFFSSNNMAVPRQLFWELGGFDGMFRGASEDRDLCERWHAAGHPLVFVPDATLAHAHNLNLRRFARQHFWYGTGAWRFQKKRKTSKTGHIVQDMAFHKNLPKLAYRRLARTGIVKSIGYVGLLGLWQFANAAGFFHAGWKDRKQA
jgi:GT2 family glycosyltransferase